MDRAPGLRQSAGDPTANPMQPETKFGLAGRRAIVTGHKGGIGAAIAAALAARRRGGDRPRPAGVRPRRHRDAWKRALAAMVAEHGPIDILVNNAGITVLGSVLETPLAEVEHVFRVNFLAAYALMRAVLPGMVERRRGAIVNIASDQALIGKQVSAAYGASKAAIAQLSRSAALDWARFGIRVNCIAPGSTDTPMLATVIGDLAAKYPDRFPTSSDGRLSRRRAAGALRAAGGDRRGGGVPGVRRGVVHHRRGAAGGWRHDRGMSARIAVVTGGTRGIGARSQPAGRGRLSRDRRPPAAPRRHADARIPGVRRDRCRFGAGPVLRVCRGSMRW